MEWSGHYLVDPWHCDGLVDLKNYPRLRAYFEKHGAALKKRHTAVKNERGWYKTIDRVTHALAEPSQLGTSDTGIRFVFNKGTPKVSTTF
jgi:adenine-specific DNA-methyltransferase